jgi:hypothetical protein
MATRDLNDIKSASYNKEELLRALRTAVMAEMDATNQYSIMAEAVTDEHIKKVIEDITHEEQVHVGEFMKLIERVCSCETDRYKEGELEAAGMLPDSLPGQALPPKSAAAIEPHPSTFKKTKITFTATPPVTVPTEQPNNKPVQFPEEPTPDEEDEEAPEEEPEEEPGEENEPEEPEEAFSIEQLNKELGQLLENDEEEE